MKHLIKFTSLLAVIVAATLVVGGHVNADTFNQNRIIDDKVFDNANSLSIGQIDAFLNTFSNSCISLNSGFKAIDPIGYNPTSGFQYGGDVTAGQVIYDAAQVYGINPQVLIVTLEKEQSLVTGQNNFSGYCNDGSQHKYAAAVGYGCPDSGTTYSYTGLNLYQRNGVTVTDTGTTCVNSAAKAGFSQQVIRAAWLLKFGEQRSEGNTSWAVIKGSWDNSDDPQTCYGGPMTQGTFARCPSGGTTFYDGYTTIDGTAVHMNDGATAALYWYTPHFHGNQNFFDIFNSWFGSTYTPDYSAQPTAQANYPTITQGSSASVYFSYKNVGNVAWYDEASAWTNNKQPVRLGTDNPPNRNSAFGSQWQFGASRAAVYFAAVYESDGVTLAANQHIVQPGQIAKFGFTMVAGPTLNPGFYPEGFRPIVEGLGPMNNTGTWLGVTVVKANYTAKPTGQSYYPTIIQGNSADAYFTYQNVGNVAWYDEASAWTNNKLPVRLATDTPPNRNSVFGSQWQFGPSRAAVYFAAVYESDGVTLAANQHIVQPGQIAKFSFTLGASNTLTPGYYPEGFLPIVEGLGPMNETGTWLGVTVQKAIYSAQPTAQANYPTITQGSSASVYFSYKNVGNVAWYDEASAWTNNKQPVRLGTDNPPNRNSAFGSQWQFGASRAAVYFAAVYESDGVTLAANQHIVQPGQIAKFGFTMVAGPTLNPGFYPEGFRPIVEGLGPMNNTGTWLGVTVVKAN